MILLAILLWLIIVAAIALLVAARKQRLSVRETLVKWFQDATR